MAGGKKQRKRSGAVFPLLFAALLASVWLSLSLGRFQVPPEQALRILCARLLPLRETWDRSMANVVLNVRLPRVLASVFVGSALSASGCTYQSIFKNPLVSPDLLGVSAGACAGASLAIVLHGGGVLVQALALAFGLLAVLLTTLLPRLFRTDTTLMLVLSGIIVGGFMNAVFGLMKYVADPDQELASIVYWTMGSFANLKRDMLPALIPAMLLAHAVLLLLRWRINLLSLGDDEARSLGVPVARLRGVCILCATALTACAVCISGTIGWVGLITPHFARLLVGEDNQVLLPASMLVGAVFITAVDWVARNLTGAEIPLSILTGFVGAPMFVLLIRLQKRELR